MSSHPVLLIHADPVRRRELRALLSGHEVLEVTSRAEALPLLGRSPLALVVSQPAEFRRLLRDLERQTPGTPRAVLCPDDPSVVQQLAALASEGYEFETVPERAPGTLKHLVEPRSAARVALTVAHTAHFVVGDMDFLADVVEASSDGLGLSLPPNAPIEALVPGLRLEHVSVQGPAGVALEPRTWVVRTLRREAGGRGRVHVGVTIEAQGGEHRARAPQRINDEVRVRGLVRRAINRQATFVLHMADGSGRREYSASAVDAAGRLVLSRPRPGHRFDAGEIAVLSFELLGSQVEASAAVLESDELRSVVAMPRSAQRRERREALRVRLTEPDGAFLSLRSPLTGATVRRRLLDLHPMGASLELEAGGEPLPPGLQLGEVTLELGGARHRCRATVQSSLPLAQDHGARRVGLRLTTDEGPERQALIDAWLARLVPDVACGSRFPFEDVWALFRQEGVRFPDYPLEARASLDTLAATHRAMGDGAHGLGKAFVFTEGGQVLGHASGLRTHSRSWLAQHLVVKSGYHRGTQISQALVNLSFDYAEALGDVDYLRGLWRTSNRWPSRVFGTVTSKLLRPGESCLTSFNPMRRPVGPMLSPASIRTREATYEDLADLLAHLRATHDPVFLKGHDLTEGELRFETLGARYRAAGLERARITGVARRDGRAVGWVVLERMTPGLFWAEWYNAFRLFLAEPDAPDARDVRHALVAWTMGALAARGATVAECLATERDLDTLAWLGFADLGRVMEYTAHRGLTREITAQVVAVFEKLTAREQRGAEGEERSS